MVQTPEYYQQWYATHQEEKRRKVRVWKEKNAFKRKCQVTARRACEFYPGTLTAKDVREIFERDNRTCHWCHRDDLCGWNLTIDHLKRINDVEHIVVACRA